VIYDGAMGSLIQDMSPTLEDFWGKENCSEVLNLSRPEMIRDIHKQYLAVGADVIETNTFGATNIVLGEFGLEDRVAEINHAAVKLAREAVAEFSTEKRPRFVAGSVGPTTKLPSLAHIRFDQMLASYVEQMKALLEAGIDVLLIETSQDILQTKIAVSAAFDAMAATGRRVPLQVQVTLQESGTMLLGTEINAALAILDVYDIDIVGLNCATGPREMNDAVRYLCHNTAKQISVLPNAGLPQNEGGRGVYKLTPQELADYHKRFIEEYGVHVVGGCCGTTPRHIDAVVKACQSLRPAVRNVKPRSEASSAYSSVPLEMDGQPVVVAEEMNTTTRVEHFRNLVREAKYDDILALSKKLVAEGSHMLDLCCAIVGEDEKGYITSILERVATRVPVMVSDAI